MPWKIDIGRDTALAWSGTVDGNELGEAQLRTLRSKLIELGAGNDAIKRLVSRAVNAWTDGAGTLTRSGRDDEVLIDGRFELALSRT